MRTSGIFSNMGPVVGRVRWVMLGALASGMLPAFAQDYPSRPVRLVVPFEAGGSTDTQARGIGAELARHLAQTVLIENRTGAAGLIGADLVAKSKPDGYTVCVCATTQTILAPYSEIKAPYDAAHDLVPVTQLWSDDGTVVVRSSLGVNSMADLVALARRSPGKLSYGSNGPGSTTHLGTLMLLNATGTSMLHVPYKGEQPAATDLIADRLDVLYLSVTVASRFAGGGKLKVLAVRGTARNNLLPDVPTLSEAGVANAESSTQGGLFVAAGTARPIVDRLYTAASQAVNAPEVKARISAAGQQPVGSRPEVYAAYLQSERERWGKVARLVAGRKD